jgi:hypothetical protein
MEFSFVGIQRCRKGAIGPNRTFGGSSRESDSSDHPPRSRPLHRPPHRWLRHPGGLRLTGYALNHPASAGSLLAEWTSMARSERLTSTRDALLASSRGQRFDLALGPSAIGHQIRGLETLFGVKLFIRGA